MFSAPGQTASRHQKVTKWVQCVDYQTRQSLAPFITSFNQEYNHSANILWAIMANVQQRKDDILAKRAKLAELKRQRELRTREVSATRQSIGGASGDVYIFGIYLFICILTWYSCLFLPRRQGMNMNGRN